MSKAFATILLLIGTALFLYFLPNLSFLFGASPSESANSPVIWLGSSGGNFQPAYWHSSPLEVLDIKKSFSDPEVFYAATNRGLMVSRDAGLNWYQWSDLEKKIDSRAVIYKIAVDSPQIFASVFKDGRGQVYKTGNNFFTLESIFEVADQAVYDLELSRNNLYLGLSDGRLLAYSLNTGEFRSLAAFGSAIIDVEAANGNLYAATRAGTLFISFNNGQSFTPLRDGLALQSNGRLNSLAVEETGSALYAAALGGLFKSLNQGLSWQPLKTLAAGRGGVDLVALSPAGELYLAAGSQLYLSPSANDSWQIILNLETKRKISSIYFADNGKIIVGTK